MSALENCLICETECSSFLHQKIQSKFYHCPHCELIFKDKNSYMDEESEHKHYAKHNNSIENVGYVAMFQDFLEKTILKDKVGTKSVLEFGSGPGPVLSELLKREGFEVEIYDKFFSPTKVYQNKKYDCITSTEVIEHIADPLTQLQFFNQHLHLGGRLCLMTQFHEDNEDTFVSWWYARDLTHITFFTKQTFVVLASLCGFRLIFCDDIKVVMLEKTEEIEDVSI